MSQNQNPDVPEEQLGEHQIHGKTFGKKGDPEELKRFIFFALRHNEILEKRGEYPHSLMVWGEPGIGKTQLIDDMATTLVTIGDKVHNGIQVVNLPVAMFEEMGDVLGLPLIVELDDGTKITRTAAPEWVPREKGPGILMFDDFNRADRRIITGFMQLVQAHRTTSWRLPPGWTIVCTGNPEMSDRHFVQNLDTAQITRARHFTLIPDAILWAAWAEGNHVDPRVINFVLRYKEMMCRGERVNPRTYAQLGQLLEDLKITDIDEINLLAQSCLDDSTTALMITFFQNDIGLTIEPEDLLANYTKKENRIRGKLTELADTRLDILTLTAERVVTYILGNEVELAGSQPENFATFLLETWFPPDLRYSMCKQLKDNKSVAMLIGDNVELLQAIAECV